MLVNQSYRYELKPNNEQTTLLRKSCGVARFAYNWGLVRRKELYKTKEGKDRFTTAITQHKELNALKSTEYPWMYEVSKCCAQEALRDLDLAYQNMYRRIKNHEKEIGRPKFKKKGVHDSFTVTGSIHVYECGIQLPRVKLLKTKEPTYKFKGKILSATVTREADRWYCSLCVEVERPNPEPLYTEIIGIDVGIKTFATISNGKDITPIQSPKPLKKYLKKVKKLHRKLSKKQKGSKNKKKAQLKLAKLYKRIKDIRKDFIAKETTKLAKTKSVIVIEDLNIAGMQRNHRLARSIGDEGWGEFKRELSYKTRWYGSKLLKINPFEPSSKRCNHCGTINKDLKLSDRTWVCLNCGAINERDENAAHNIRDYGIAMLDTDSLSEFQACGVDVRPSYLMAINGEAGSKRIYSQDCNK